MRVTNPCLGSSTGDDWSPNYEDTKPFEKTDNLAEEIADNLHKQNKNTRSMFGKVERGCPICFRISFRSSDISDIWN